MRIRSIAISALVGASLVVSACSGAAPAAPTAAPSTAPTAAAAAPTAAPTAASALTTAPTAATAATAAPTTAAASASTPGAATPAAAAQPTQSAASRITGNIQAIAGDKITLADGTSFTVPSTVRIISLVATQASDLQVGQYVAVTAKRQPDNTLLASIVNVFPPAMKGVGIGQRPMAGGDLMTNATISAVTATGFTVTFPGGGAQVTLAPNAKVNMFKLMTLSDLTEGTSVSALIADGVARQLAVLPAATAGSATTGGAAATSSTSVTVATDPKLGSFLVAANGRTLYKFANDKPNVSNCTGACVGNWPPYTVSGTPTLPSGVAGQLSVITRPDGIHQLAYNGTPLYYFAKDTKPGDTLGQGVAGKWAVVAPGA